VHLIRACVGDPNRGPETVLRSLPVRVGRSTVSDRTFPELICQLVVSVEVANVEYYKINTVIKLLTTLLRSRAHLSPTVLEMRLQARRSRISVRQVVFATNSVFGHSLLGIDGDTPIISAEPSRFHIRNMNVMPIHTYYAISRI